MSVDGPNRPPDPPPPPPPPEPPSEGIGDHMDPILASNVAAMREESALLRAQGNEQGAAESDAAAARYEAMISPDYRAGAEVPAARAPADAHEEIDPMQSWEAKMDPILASNAAAMREESALLRAQGNEQGAAESDAAAARFEAMISPDYQAPGDGSPDSGPAPPPPDDGARAMERWDASMDPILADNVAAIRAEADLLRSQGNEQGALECEAAAARYEAMINPDYFTGGGR